MERLQTLSERVTIMERRFFEKEWDVDGIDRVLVWLGGQLLSFKVLEITPEEAEVYTRIRNLALALEAELKRLKEIG